MIFSKSCEYAFRAVAYICQHNQDGVRFNVKEISSEIDSPEYFTSKILQSLVRQKIISSSKGPKGGFYIAANSKPVKLYDIIIAIEGPDFFERCVMGLKKCSDKNPCPLHTDFKQYKTGLKALFQTKTIHEILSVSKNGKLNLK